MSVQPTEIASTSGEAKTIQFFLPTGEPRGIRIAEITTRIVQVVAVPRSDLGKAKSRPELDHVALYFLLGESEESAKPLVYVGQTEDLRKRLDQHNASKDFWQVALLVISRIHRFTQAHIRYLEWFCIQSAKQAGRFQVENGNGGSKPWVTEPMEADLADVYATMGILVASLGYPLFDPVVKPRGTVEQFYLKSKEAEATGELVEDGFVVHAGAISRLDASPSALATVSSLRQPLLEAGVIAVEDGRVVFRQDYLFRTPSGAATVVLGRKANGWIEWNSAAGETLHDSRRGIENEAE